MPDFKYQKCTNYYLRYILPYLNRRIVVLAMLVFVGQALHSQSLTIISGKVTDRSTKEPLPYVNIYFKGTSVGTITDQEGYYSLRTTQDYDSLVASFIGYKTQVRIFSQGKDQSLNFWMVQDLVNLKEVVVMSGENPAWKIIRNAVEKKSIYNKKALKAFEYDSYQRVELYFDDISDRLNKKKVFKKIWEEIDSTTLTRGPDGHAMLPVFMSESVSKYYVKNNPSGRREEILKTKIQGLSIEDGSTTAQFIGASYQEYNFYNNWLQIMSRRFVSPIADGWKMYYDYDILDTTYVDNINCYKLKVLPRHLQDPAFQGIIWISVDGYALKKVDLFIDESANLNFVEGLYVNQILNPTVTGPLLPVETDVIIDIGQLTFNTSGMLFKSHNSTSGWIVNQKKEDKFYENEVFVAEDVTLQEKETYWDQVRPRPLTESQLQVYEAIEDVKQIPMVKSYVSLIKMLSTGYIKVGKIDIGPYLYSYAYNNFEGHSIRLGFRTNYKFSRKVVFRGYGGYGTMDQRWKYGVGFTGIIKRNPWMTFDLGSSYDVEQAGLKSEDLQNNNLFFAATRFKTLTRPYYHANHKISFNSEIVKGLSQSVSIRNEYFDPQFPFYYYTDPGSSESLLERTFYVTSISIGLHWARDEVFAQNDNERLSLGTRKAPAIDVLYTQGIKDVFGGDFNYQKISLGFKHKLRMGFLGDAKYRINAGYIFGQVPYLILENHIGNESIFYTNSAFNTMNYFEFVSDHYASLRYEHYFQGLLLNKVPLFKRLKWRLLANFNVLYGGLRQENIDIMSPVDPDGNLTLPYKSLGDVPYVEIGYGIENIFKFFRIDAFHRLTYRDEPNATRFSLKIIFQFKL